MCKMSAKFTLIQLSIEIITHNSKGKECLMDLFFSFFLNGSSP